MKIFNILPNKINHSVNIFRKQINNFLILYKYYGQFKSIKTSQCIDFQENPIPWYTYPAIEYLSHMDFSNMNVFEYGSGHSTLFWSKNTKNITSVEDNIDWYNKIKTSEFFNAKINYIYKNNKKDYIKSIYTLYKNDIVVIDGKYRQQCAAVASNYFQKNENGILLIFDNSDWYPKTISKLKNSLKWIQIDFHGFGPINNYTWTTTIFVNPKNVDQINYSYRLKPIGGLLKNEDQE